jgi:hypothetical protein
MKVTKQHKILCAVLALGGVAVLCDRFFVLGENTDASENPSQEYAIAPTPQPVSDKPPAAAASAPAKAQRPSLSARLRAMQQILPEQSPRDAFVLGAAWNVKTPAAVVDTSAEQFRSTHKLTGVLTSGGRAHAMIDGKITGIGEKVDGFKLVEISHRAAVLEANNIRVVLQMNDSGAGVARVE